MFDTQNKTHTPNTAFTLAEVLITLAIIGVVAAITIPTIAQKIEHTTLRNQFKENYAILNQALQQTMSDNGNVAYQCFADSSYNYSVSECPNFWPIFISKIKILEKRTGSVDSIYSPAFLGQETIVSAGGALRNGTCFGFHSSAPNRTFLFLANGSNIGSYNASFFSFNHFTIDINGTKKPNKWGYDIFGLDFLRKTPTSSVTITDTLCGAKEKGGYWIYDLLSE